MANLFDQFCFLKHLKKNKPGRKCTKVFTGNEVIGTFQFLLQLMVFRTLTKHVYPQDHEEQEKHGIGAVADLCTCTVLLCLQAMGQGPAH